MKRVRVLFMRLAGLFAGEKRDRDLTEEIETNLQLHIDENLLSGMTPDEARRRAILKLGGIENTKEAYRDRATLPLFENLLRDIRLRGSGS